MKIKIIALLFLAAGIAARAELTPDTLVLTWNRADITTTDATKKPLAGVTYTVAGTANIATNTPQDLSALLIAMRIGDSDTNLLWYGTANVLTNGAFSATVQFPVWTVNQRYGLVRTMGVELTLLDVTNGVTMTYSARKQYEVTLPMGGTNTGNIMVSTNLITITSPVPSVFGRTGPITATNGDYTAAQVGAVATNDAAYLATVTNGASPTFPAITFSGATNWTVNIGNRGGTNALRFVSAGATNWINFQP
jgi:hypothetical protein